MPEVSLFWRDTAAICLCSRIGICAGMRARAGNTMRVRVPPETLRCEAAVGASHSINIGRYAKWLSKRTVTPLPSGAVGSNPTLLTIRRSPSNRWRSCLEDFRSVIPACGFESRLWRYTGMCANRAGSLSRKQVIRKGLGVRIPPSSLLIRSGVRGTVLLTTFPLIFPCTCV